MLFCSEDMINKIVSTLLGLNEDLLKLPTL